MPRIYTKTGDDGTTGLLYGGRVSKAHLVPEACGTLQEKENDEYHSHRFLREYQQALDKRVG